MSAATEMLPAQLAKAALRRLAVEKLEPTPENYARAYQQEQGGAAPSMLPERAQRVVERLAQRALPGDGATGLAKAMALGRWEQAERVLESADSGGEQLADLIDRIVRGMERRTRQWTSARKKDSLQRVLEGSRGDAARLQQRLRQLVTSWEHDGDAGDSSLTGAAPLDDTPGAPADTAPGPLTRPGSFHLDLPPPDADPVAAPTPLAWERVVESLDGTVRQALPQEVNARRLADAVAEATRRIRAEGATADLADELAALCAQADQLLLHRHHFVDGLSTLCRELTESLVELSEDDSWAKGQCEAMRVRIDEGLSARGVKSVSELLRDTRVRQMELREERARARDALKSLVHRMLADLSELGMQTGRFHESVGRYADVIEKADSIESLAGLVRDMVEESRSVQVLVAQTQQRLNDEHSQATQLRARVDELEAELLRLSDEVSTDQLTQIANRRGLLQQFEAERSRIEREAASQLSIGLLDIDNFKRLNDELGHGAGDEALRSLAQVVSRTLRPTDHVARYGGEEFVVLLPDTPVNEGQQILTRLQRSLSGGLFMHESKQVFVTFSAGVTRYCPGERIEEALERADAALYEAKRTGKNRTCVG